MNGVSAEVNVRRTFRLTLAGLLAAAILVSACADDDGTARDETNHDDLLAAVTTALEKKNGWEQGGAKVMLNSVEDGRFARGSVIDPAGSGALWFASLEDGDWEIVWDGNGIVDCASLERHRDFPSSFLPQCIDAGGNLQARE